MSAQFGDADKQVDNLLYLSKVWGFVKHYHPEVQNCSEEWDEALFQTLDELNGAPQEDYQYIVEGLIDKLGEPAEASGSAPTLLNDEEYNNLDISWINDGYLSQSNVSKLSLINDRSRYRVHCLFEPIFFEGNLSFESEKIHSSGGNYPPLNHRILALFRFWNTIEYFFPYKHLMDQDWNTTFRQFIMPIINAKDAVDYHLTMFRLRPFLNDSHAFVSSYVYGIYRGNELAPYVVKYIEGETVVTKVASNLTELEVGDILIEVDGVPIQEFRDSIRLMVPASNEVVQERNINNAELRWGNDIPYDIKVEKANGTLLTITDITRSYNIYQFLHFPIESNPSWTTYEVEECGEFGYVDMGLLESDEVSSMMAELKDKPAIIFDIRSYPNETLWYLMPELFDGLVPVADFSYPNHRYAGDFGRSEVSLGGANNPTPYEGTVIILFNEDTQSQAEYTVMGLEMHENSIKIGSTTSGADGNVSTIDLPGNITMYFTGLGTYYPDGTQTQRVGIIPDIEVNPTIEGIRNGIDEVLEFALSCESIVTNTKNVYPKERDFVLAPNPSSDFVQILSLDDFSFDIKFHDTQGKLVFQQSIQTNEQIDLSQLPQGLYILSWQENEKMYKRKFVRQ